MSDATAPLSLHETAVRLGRSIWIEERLFEVVGGWVLDTPEPVVARLLATESRHHGWRAEAIGRVLPLLHDLDEDAEDVRVEPATMAGLDALAVVPTTLERLAALARVVLPRTIVATRRHLDRLVPIADAPISRELGFVLADMTADWLAAAGALDERIASPADARRAADGQMSIEAFLVG